MRSSSIFLKSHNTDPRCLTRCNQNRTNKAMRIQNLHTGDDGLQRIPQGNASSSSHASIWAPFAETTPPPPCPVTTQKGVPTFKHPTPDDPCEECQGTGKTTCDACCGKGRVNSRNKAMLSKGEWPKWCRDCRATGRSWCLCCMGTGVEREPIGFRV